LCIRGYLCRMRLSRYFLSLIIFLPLVASGQSVRLLKAGSADKSPLIDGMLNEEMWITADSATGFWQNFPYDSAISTAQTVVKVAYDKNFIYVGAVCYNARPGRYTITSLRRDFDFSVSDAFGFYIDTFSDLFNGYSFTVNPEGVQREGLLANGGSESADWDCKWYAETKKYEGYWTVEMAIPLGSIKYPVGAKSWRVNFGRVDMAINERSSWQPIPRIFGIQNLAYTGELLWQGGGPPQSRNVALIPYGIGRFAEDYTNADPGKVTPNVGLDARLTVLKSLNLDLTVNPDFSQVEVDRQITNLSRFSLFFPELRNFFLENNDLFGMFGFRNIRPFFSRRIGLYEGQTVPIPAGARLSGKINKNWRIGVMNMQTEGVRELDLRPQNYSVAAVQRTVGARSNLAGIVVNRTGFDGFRPDWKDYNSLFGLDYNIWSKDNKFRGKLFYHHTVSPGVKENNFAHASWLMYTNNHWNFMWNHEYVGNNFRADVGFVPRIENYDPLANRINYFSYWRLEPEVSYTWFPKSKYIQAIWHTVYLNHYMDANFKPTEYVLNPRTEITFKNQAYMGAGVMINYTRLLYPFDVAGLDAVPLPAGEYPYVFAGIWMNSSPSKLLVYSGGFDYGQYFTGTRTAANASIGYRYQPFGSISLSINYNGIRLPDPYSDANLLLVGPRVDLSFTRNLFFTTFIQYNTQVNNVNVNSRLQWRFKPMSDLFIVYTDNYNSPNMAIKNRALVIKLSYWFNV